MLYHHGWENSSQTTALAWRLSATLRAGLLIHIFLCCTPALAAHIDDELPRATAFHQEQTVHPRILRHERTTLIDFSRWSKAIIEFELSTRLRCYSPTTESTIRIDTAARTLHQVKHQHYGQTEVLADAFDGDGTSRLVSRSAEWARLELEITDNRLEIVGQGTPCGDTGTIIRPVVFWVFGDYVLPTDITTIAFDNTAAHAQGAGTNSGQLGVHQSSAIVDLSPWPDAIVKVESEIYTNCQGRSASATVLVDTKRGTLHGQSYSHFVDTEPPFEGFRGNGTAELISASGQLGSNGYRLIGTELHFYSLSNECGTWNEAHTNNYWVFTDYNHPPVLGEGARPPAATEDSPYQFSFPASAVVDPAGDAITLSVSGLPDWLHFDAATKRFSGTPVEGDEGDTTVTVRAAESGGLSTEFPLLFSAQAINDNVPVFASSAAHRSPENSLATGYIARATDVDTNDILSYSISGGADAAAFSIDANSGSLSWMAEADFEAPDDADANGVYQVTLRATDAAGNAGELDLALRLTDRNEAPSAAAGQVLQVGEFAPLKHRLGALRGEDPDGDTLRWTLLDESAPFSLSADGDLTVSRALDYERRSSYELAIRVSDGRLSDTATVAVSVLDGDEVEQLQHVSAQIVERAGNPQQLLEILAQLSPPVDPPPPALATPLANRLLASPTPADRNEVQNRVDALLTQVAARAVLALSVEQGGRPVAAIRPRDGEVTLRAEQSAVSLPGVASATEQLQFDWSATDARVRRAELGPPSTSNTLVFDPSALSAGDQLQLRVAGMRRGARTVAQLVVPVVGGRADLSDADKDGVPDALEGELNAQGHPDRENALQTIGGEDQRFVLRSAPGTRLRLGRVARSALLGQAGIQPTDIQRWQLHDDDQPVWPLPGIASIRRPTVTIYDFEVGALPFAGSTATVVIPLGEVLGEGANYYKHTGEHGWRPFVRDYLNRVAGATATTPGSCPDTSDASYRDGLREGDNCIRLTLEDGGPNDADGIANGTVVDPGGIFYDTPEALVRTGLTGLGALAPGSLALCLLVGFRAARRRPIGRD